MLCYIYWVENRVLSYNRYSELTMKLMQLVRMVWSANQNISDATEARVAS